ncbi:MAG: hypothetical protein IT379_33360 [Deltaproteobacteria bacterium]|nr:hypothetical protein [Deltaproteobacteria bacterium]
MRPRTVSAAGPTWVAMGAALALCLAMASQASAQRRRGSGIDPRARRGFTLEAGLGVGFTQVFPDVGDGEGHVGIAPLSFSVGGYVNPRLALLFRASGTSYFDGPGRGRLRDSVVAAVYAFHVKWWVLPRLYLGGGGGLAAFGGLFDSDDADDLDLGFGTTFRIGLAFPVHRKHALGVAFELMTMFTGEATLLAQAVTFEWHFY